MLLVSSALVDAPLLLVTVQPNRENGLQKPSQVMVNRANTDKKDKKDKFLETFGNLNADSMLEIERCLAVFPGLAK